MSSQNLKEALKQLNKSFKSGNISVGVEFPEITRIPFSSPRLNYMTYGGLPFNRVIEFSGADGSGKTTTALDIVAQAQKVFPKKQAIFVDIEGTFDPTWADTLGVDVDSLIYYNAETQTAETIFENVLTLIETGDVSVVVIDSIAVMVTNAQDEKTLDQKTYGGIASVLTMFCRKVVPLLIKHSTMLIGINQIRDDLNSAYGGTITTGGKAWKHAHTVRMVFRKGQEFDESGAAVNRNAENPAGHQVTVRLDKTKIFRPDRRVGFYTLNYIEGIDYITDFIDVAIKEDIIEMAGSWIKFKYKNEDLKCQGKAKFKQYLKDNIEVYEYLNSLL